MTMHKALHKKDGIDRLYVSRKEVGRGIATIEDNVDASIRRLEAYIKKSEHRNTNYSNRKKHKQHNDQQNNNS